MKRIVLTLALLIAATNAFAWGEAGHLMSNEAATLSLPADMPWFFYRAFPQLIWLGYQPDRLRSAGPSLDATNLPDHFLNYEMVDGLNLPPDRYKYVELLGSSGRLAHLGVANTVPSPVAAQLGCDGAARHRRRDHQHRRRPRAFRRGRRESPSRHVELQRLGDAESERVRE